jgi:hypothetical protein
VQGPPIPDAQESQAVTDWDRIIREYSETEVEAAAKAHRSQCLQVKRIRFVGGPPAKDILVSGRRSAVYPGGELVVGARFNEVATGQARAGRQGF